MQYSATDQYKQTSQIRTIGYELTTPVAVTIPVVSESSSIFTSLFSILSNSNDKKSLFNMHASKKVEILNEKTLVLTQSNKLVVYHYKVVEDKMQMTPKSCFLLSEEIARVSCSSAGWFQRVENCNYFVVQFVKNTSFAVYQIDHNFSVSELSAGKTQHKILKIKFISLLEFIVVTESGSVQGYRIKGRNLQMSGKYKPTLETKNEVKSAEVCVFMNESNKFYLFLGLFCAQSDKSSINLFELSKQKKSIQLLSKFQNIFQSNISQKMVDRLQIYTFQKTFLVKSNKTLVVLEKRFSRYVCTDAISDISDFISLLVIDLQTHFFLCTISALQVEIWQLQRKQLGFKCKLMDLIETDGTSLAHNLLKVWIFKSNKIELVFLTNTPESRSLNVYLTQKGDKLGKLVERVKKEEKLKGSGKFGKQEFNSKIKKIEELGIRLGIKKREFYLKLWHNSEKNSTQIFEYLLPCLDFNAIFQQLELYLRMKTLKISEMVKILRTIESSLLEELTKRLDLSMIQRYLTCNFQRRKLKLYSGEMSLNFQKYSKISELNIIRLIQYSIDLQLFPEKFYHDIRWKQQQLDIPLEISHILRQFRLVILQDFTGFLLQLLEPYKHSLIQIISRFHYLLPEYPLKISIIRDHMFKLSNIYPEEKIDENQHFWLGYITQLEWEEEESSLHFLMNHMHPYFHTSTINDKMKEFCDSNIYSKDRNKQYVLLMSSRADFEEKLPRLNDATSLITLLQRENRIAMELNKESHNKQILKIMAEKNSLPPEQYQKFLRLSELQTLLIKQRLIDSSTTILQLMQIPDFKLVRFFFLGEKARLGVLFQDVSALYTNETQFTKVIKGYVESEECSIVELQMLVRYTCSYDNQQMAKSQQIFEIVIEGFMKRIEIREINKAAIFLKLMKEIPLTEQLIKQLSIFESVKSSCYTILRDMKMAKLTYHTLIVELDIVIQTLVNNYFQEFVGKDISIYIQHREISLLYPRNLFAIVLYFKDKIYSYRQEVETYLSFGFALAAWNQFDLIQQCFGQGLIIDDEEVASDQFYYLLISNLIKKYEENSELVYDEETIQHVVNLITLLSENSSLKIIQRAKIEISDILQTLGYKVSFQYMRLIQEQWSAGPNERMVLFKEIINQFWPIVNFQTFKQLYHLLEVIRLGSYETVEKSEEMVKLSKFLCKKLINKSKYHQICEIIYYLNLNEKVLRAGESLMSECFLQMITLHEFQSIEEMAEHKLIVDYYLANETNIEAINKLFLYKFSRLEVNKEQIQSQIKVNLQVSKQGSGQPCRITADQIWNFVISHFKLTFKLHNDESRITSKSKLTTKSRATTKQKAEKKPQAHERQAEPKQIFYIYFFIYKIFVKPTFVLDLKSISFNHEKNTFVLDCMLKDSRYSSCLFFDRITLNYLRGLYKLYYLITLSQEGKKVDGSQTESRKVQVTDISQKLEFSKMDQEKLIISISQITKTPQNAHIYYSLKKLASIIVNQTKKWQHQIIKQVITIGVKAVQKEAAASMLAIFQQNNLKESTTHNALPTLQKTYKFSEFEKRKQKYQLHRNITCQKIIIEKVLEDLNDNSFDSFNDMSSEFKRSIKKLNTNQRDSKEFIDLGEVLGDLKIEDEQKQTETIINDLKSLCSWHCDEQIVENIRVLIHEKQYDQIQQLNDNRLILKVITEQFFSNIELKSVPKVSSYVVGSRRRPLRSNTIKTFDQSQSKVLQLIELLQHLKISQNVIKLRILRQTLVLLSSDFLIQLEGYILMLFKLNILLDPSRNVRLILNHMIQNISEHNNFSLQSFEELVKLAEFFLAKCKDQSKKVNSQTYIGRQQTYYQSAKLYRVYLLKLFQSEKSLSLKKAELSKIMEILGNQQLSEINQAILSALQSKEELLEFYILSIYQRKEVRN